MYVLQGADEEDGVRERELYAVVEAVDEDDQEAGQRQEDPPEQPDGRWDRRVEKF